MSHIPETAMKHAHVDDQNAGQGDAQTGQGANGAQPTDKQLVSDDPTLGDKAREGVETAKDAIKSHPKTAIGVGAAVVFGVVAAVAAPAVIAKVKDKDGTKKATPKKAGAKKAAAAK